MERTLCTDRTGGNSEPLLAAPVANPAPSTQHRSTTMHPNARRLSESLKQYHHRLKEEREALRERLRGVVVWDSSKRGTFKRERRA